MVLLFGGMDKALSILLILMVVDIASGLLKAIKNADFTSKAFRTGLMQKAGFFLVIILAYQIDVMLGQTGLPVRTATALFYIGVEGTSIIENLGALGVHIPKVISSKLGNLAESVNNTDTNDTNKKDN